MFQGYMASPYSVLPEDDPAIRHWRYMEAVMAIGWAYKQGLCFFSPIVHSHPVAERCGFPKDFGYWERYDRSAIAACRDFYILLLSGWQASGGLQRELQLVETYQPEKDIFYLHKQNPGEYIITPTNLTSVWMNIDKAQCTEPDCRKLGAACPRCEGRRLEREFLK